MKNIYQKIIVIIAVIYSIPSVAQQDPLYTQYYNNFNIINPAYVGTHGFWSGAFNLRSQWAGESDGPQTQTLSFHGPAGKNVGLGFSVVHDKVFVMKQTDVYADFSYSIATSESSTLSLGLKAGGSFLNVDLLDLGLESDNLFNENINQFNPNLGVGAFFFTNKFFASLSASNLFKTKHYDKNSTVVSSASEELIFYLSSGYVFDIGQNFDLKPSFLMRSVNNSPLSTDISLSLLWDNKLEFGISHRIEESISGMVQIAITNNIKLSYSYDGIINDLSNYNNGSHEIGLIVDFGASEKYASKIKAPFYWLKNKKYKNTEVSNEKE